MKSDHNEEARIRARALAAQARERGDATGWFEQLYSGAAGDAATIPWAELGPNPYLEGWWEAGHGATVGGPALVIGSGLGDDAEFLAARGLTVTAFDIAPSAIEWAQRRFPASTVRYQVADLLLAPAGWRQAFGFVFEAFTVQALPHELRERAIAAVAGLVAPGGTLLVVCRGREPDEPEGSLPWPLTREELREFERHGLAEQRFEQQVEPGDPPNKRFRVTYRRPG